MTGRYHGDESKKDVHEKDVEYLARSRRAAEYCAAHLGWKTIACNQADAMRSIEEIGAEVYAVAQSMLNARTEAAK
jgi:dTMP kinase